tara:strand:+ start:321 stop:500 length:180 start_codon:yes stop_codon:yes gene_type:complete
MRLFGKIRPQIMVALLLLGAIALVSIQEGLVEVSVGCIAGIIALSKDVLQSDSGPTKDE